MEAAFALGDYPTVISRIEENEEISSGRKKSLLVRSLLLSDQGEYAQGLLNSDSSLDRALAVYARAVVQSTSSTTDWKFIEAEAMVVGDYEGTELRDETAIVLSRTYALSGNLQAAYRLAAQTPSLEA